MKRTVEKKPWACGLLFLAACCVVLFHPIASEPLDTGARMLAYVFILIFLGMATWRIVRRRAALFPSLLLFDILFLFYPYMLWQRSIIPLSFTGILYVLPVLIYLCIVLAVRRLRVSRPWLRPGSIDGFATFLMGIVIVLSAGALIGWASVTKPDLGLFLTWMPDYTAALMVLAGLGFALSNGFVEELIFRAVLWEGLAETFKKPLPVLLLQALLFGLWHWRGFPGGPSGMALVFVWGLFLGWLRLRTMGMLGPFICHVFADLTIFGILYAVLEGWSRWW
jgi:membrane protease YdiL (CAAX protease family)